MIKKLNVALELYGYFCILFVHLIMKNILFLASDGRDEIQEKFLLFRVNGIEYWKNIKSLFRKIQNFNDFSYFSNSKFYVVIENWCQGHFHIISKNTQTFPQNVIHLTPSSKFPEQQPKKFSQSWIFNGTKHKNKFFLHLISCSFSGAHYSDTLHSLKFKLTAP